MSSMRATPGTDSSTGVPLSGTAGIGADFVWRRSTASVLRFPRGVIAAAPVFDAKGGVVLSNNPVILETAFDG
jgi:hypothetical protein